MTRDETKSLLMAVQSTYPNWKPVSLEEAVNQYYDALTPFPVEIVAAAWKAYRDSDMSGYAPVPGQIIGKIVKPTTNALEAWSQVYNALQDSIYHANEHFSNLPKTVQKAIGSPDILRQWAVTDYEQLPTLQAHFTKVYNIEAQREREIACIPENVRRLLNDSSKLLTGDTA